MNHSDSCTVKTFNPLLGRNVRFLAEPGFANFVREDVAQLQTRPPMRSVLQETLAKRALVEGLVLEFGVFSGKSINVIAKAMPERDIFGFDSFEGLPSDWELTGSKIKIKKSIFDTKDVLPSVPGNVKLIKGYFANTLPDFLDTHPGPISFVHIDCDIYSSTKDVFDLCASRFVPGTVIVFDEFFDYLHEARAFYEFLQTFGWHFDWIGHGGDGGFLHDSNAFCLIRKNMSWWKAAILRGMMTFQRKIRQEPYLNAAAAVVLK